MLQLNIHSCEPGLEPSMLLNKPHARWRADRKPTSLNGNPEDEPQYAHPIYSLCIHAPLIDFLDADLDDFWYFVLTASSSCVVHKGDTKDQVVTFTNMVVVV